MCLGAIGDVLSNEASHVKNLFGQMGDSPGKTLEQFALGAADPFGAKLWGKVTGQDFTPLVGQMGGETNAQFAESRKQGVDTGTSQTLGQIANVVAAAVGSYGLASGGAGAAAGLGGDTAAAGAGAEAGAGGASAGAGASEGAAATLPADVSVGTTGAGGATATAGGGAEAGAGAGAGAGGGSSAWVDYAKTAGKVLAPAVLSSVLAPKAPKAAKPQAMPDPLAQQQSMQQKIIDQMARRGRASTILTSPGNAGGSLGG